MSSNGCLPVLRKMGSTVTLTGAVGAGNVTKIANQIMVACNIAAMGEALVLATRAGLDPEVVFNFKPGFRICLHEKDLRNALLAAESMKVALPFTSLAQQILIALTNEGKGDLDHSAIVTFIEQMAGTEVKRALAAQV
jgi:2-hydroxy-3-oxopropionate reductase